MTLGCALARRRCLNLFAMRFRALVFLLLLIAACWSAPVVSTADGPDFFAVTGVADNDVLNIRAGPSAHSEKIGEIPYDARRVRNLGCRGLPSFGEWETMTGQQRRDSRKNYWCRVGFGGREGWVAGRFLREDGD